MSLGRLDLVSYLLDLREFGEVSGRGWGMTSADKILFVLWLTNIGLAFVYAAEKNWGKALYWFGASCINTAVLWLWKD